MVNFELRRDRIVARWGDQKYEWVIEPRYWRNPAIGVALLAILPLFVYSYPNILTMITTANLYAAVAIPLGLQMLGTARVNFGPQLFLGIGGYTAALLNLHFGFESGPDPGGHHPGLRRDRPAAQPDHLDRQGPVFFTHHPDPAPDLSGCHLYLGRPFPRGSGSGGDEPLVELQEGHLELSGLFLSVSVADAELSVYLRQDRPLPVRGQPGGHQRK